MPPKIITRRLLGREDLVSLVTGFQFTRGNLVRACLQYRDHDDLKG